MSDWRGSLVITEEPGKCNGVLCTIFYIREKPSRPGFSYQSTATTMDAALWVVQQLRHPSRIGAAEGDVNCPLYETQSEDDECADTLCGSGGDTIAAGEEK